MPDDAEIRISLSVQGEQQLKNLIGQINELHQKSSSFGTVGERFKKLAEGVAALGSAASSIKLPALSQIDRLVAMVQRLNRVQISSGSVDNLNKLFTALNLADATNYEQTAMALDKIAASLTKVGKAMGPFAAGAGVLSQLEQIRRLIQLTGAGAAGAALGTQGAGGGQPGFVQSGGLYLPGHAAQALPSPAASQAAGAFLDKLVTNIQVLAQMSPEVVKAMQAQAREAEAQAKKYAAKKHVEEEEKHTEQMRVQRSIAQIRHKDLMAQLPLMERKLKLDEEYLPTRIAESIERTRSHQRKSIQLEQQHTLGIQAALRPLRQQMGNGLPTSQDFEGQFLDFVTQVAPVMPEVQNILGAQALSPLGASRRLRALSSLPGAGFGAPTYGPGFQGVQSAAMEQFRAIASVAMSQQSPAIIPFLQRMTDISAQMRTVAGQDLREARAAKNAPQARASIQFMRALEQGGILEPSGMSLTAQQRIQELQNRAASAEAALARELGVTAPLLAQQGPTFYSAQNVAANTAIMRTAQGAGGLYGRLSNANLRTLLAGVEEAGLPLGTGLGLLSAGGSIAKALVPAASSTLTSYLTGAPLAGFVDAAGNALPATLGMAGGAAASMAAIAVPAALLAAAAIPLGKGVQRNLEYYPQFSPLMRQFGLLGKQSQSSFVNSVLSPGIRQGYEMAQASQAAQQFLTLSGTLGGGVAGLAPMFQSARALGVNPSQMAQLFGTTAALQGGLDPQRFAAMIGQAVSDAQMSGRSGEFFQALQSTMQNLANTLVSPNATVAAAQLAWIGNLSPSLKGTRAAQILAQVQQGMANPGLGPAGQLLEMQALQTPGMSLPQLLFSMQMGPTFVAPGSGGRSNLQLLLQSIQQRTGVGASSFNKGNNFYPLTHAAGQAELMLSHLLHIPMSEAGALLSGSTSALQKLTDSLQTATKAQKTQMTQQETIIKTLNQAALNMLEASNSFMSSVLALARIYKAGTGATLGLLGGFSKLPSGPSKTLGGVEANSKLMSLVKTAAQGSGLPESLIAAVMAHESGGNPNAYNANANGTFDFGLMQLNSQSFPNAKNMTPLQNVLAGSDYLNTLIKRFHGHTGLGLLAYNSGPGAVAAALKYTHASSFVGLQQWAKAHGISSSGSIHLPGGDRVRLGYVSAVENAAYQANKDLNVSVTLQGSLQMDPAALGEYIILPSSTATVTKSGR